MSSGVGTAVKSIADTGTDFTVESGDQFLTRVVNTPAALKTVGLPNDDGSCSRASNNHTVADTFGGRTCGPDALDNLGSRECDRYREHLRQLIMPSRSRPMPTGANAGRPACADVAASLIVKMQATRHRGHLCAQWTLNGRRCVLTTLRTARRLPGRRGNDISKLRTDASGYSSPTGLTTLTRA
ncbi:hypothetical protein EVAR_66949_1 [Eumeta japonica]|uniref:Uncharacterized protein n=1 Tax=Eumeta variegata TaxID=151549 RepID=A0A4C1SAV5_EUMVA|nr:hypothetical protein EVAR_66949_1 [Eumeta japonica]